jgi:hypothetical protein
MIMIMGRGLIHFTIAVAVLRLASIRFLSHLSSGHCRSWTVVYVTGTLDISESLTHGPRPDQLRV